MADSPAFQPPTGDATKRWALIAVGVIALLAVVWFLYRVFTDIEGVTVQEAPPTVVDMLPPPPPPPPPPEPQEKPPEPLDNPQPNPEPVPDTAPKPMQIDGPAQAGSDAYGMQAGSSGGMGAPSSQGLCTGLNCARAVAGTDRFWGRNIANALEAHIESSRTVNVDSFVSEYEVWVSDTGVLTRARLVKSSGNSKLDQTVLALLETARGLKPPPPSIRMPQRVKVGRKRF